MSMKPEWVKELQITSERVMLREYLDKDIEFPTEVKRIKEASIPNPVSEKEIGAYRALEARKSVTADMEIIEGFIKKGKLIPSFLEAGPRAKLAFDPESVRAAVVTTGGLAPGLNSVVHSIVERHWKTYKVNKAKRGVILGIKESFMGLYNMSPQPEEPNPEKTEDWLEKGGSVLGSRRFRNHNLDTLTQQIIKNLNSWDIDILYIIGGDGSLAVAHAIASKTDRTVVVGVPKTMDNDILWVWHSFGFDTAVERAANVITTMHFEAESTGRICILELFGAQSGFVAANAALASGHVDLVLIPEEFSILDGTDAKELLGCYSVYFQRLIRGKDRAHGVIVVAEGVDRILKGLQVSFEPQGGNFVEQLKVYLENRLEDRNERRVEVFINQPRHNIRATPASAQDHIYCKRLGALAVDNALAGYTDFMISQWLTEYVLVPLEIVVERQKRIPPGGIFWKQAVSMTGQPLFVPKTLRQTVKENSTSVKLDKNHKGNDE